MSKTKRLLSVTLAIAMIILSAFSAFAEDTETVVETVGAMSVAAASIETDDKAFDVNVKISFNEVVTGPHNIITLTCEKFNLTDVVLGDVVYKYTDLDVVNGETVQLPQGKVTIAEDGVKNVNWATGKVLIEAPVDVNAPLVSEINLTATFTLKADVALVAGETLNIAVANDDMADANEAKLSISSGASVVTVTAAEVTYDVTPKITGDASHLVEPWGIKFVGTYTGADTDKISVRGMAMVLEKDYVDTFSTDPASMVAADVAYNFTDNATDDYKVNYDGSSYSALLTEGIKTQNIGDKVYVVPYVIMENGTYIYGKVLSDSMIAILDWNKDASNVSATEQQVCKDMIALYNATVAHFEGKDMNSLLQNDVIATRGNAQTAATSWKQDTANVKIVGDATRLVEPWGIKFESKYYADKFDSEVTEYGMAIIPEYDYLEEYASNFESMRLSENTYIYTTADETLRVVSNNSDGSVTYSAMLTEDVYVYNIKSYYYCVPFVKLADDSYVYGKVISDTMDAIISWNANVESVPQTEKTLGACMQTLYESVCAHYNATSWPSFIR